jgi:hypothetical protein
MKKKNLKIQYHLFIYVNDFFWINNNITNRYYNIFIQRKKSCKIIVISRHCLTHKISVLLFD